jgi:hypothetical protein
LSKPNTQVWAAQPAEARLRAGRTGRRAYSRPRLRRLGDVRDFTLGPTPGIGESGGSGVLKL